MSKTVPTTIDLKKSSLKNLVRMAKVEGETVSEIINDLLSLPSRKKKTGKTSQNPLADIVGIAHTSLGDAAENHDAYLYKETNPHK